MFYGKDRVCRYFLSSRSSSGFAFFPESRASGKSSDFRDPSRGSLRQEMASPKLLSLPPLKVQSKRNSAISNQPSGLPAEKNRLGQSMAGNTHPMLPPAIAVPRTDYTASMDDSDDDRDGSDGGPNGTVKRV